VIDRRPAACVAGRGAAVVRLVEQHGERLAGCFVVVQPARV